MINTLNVGALRLYSKPQTKIALSEFQEAYASFSGAGTNASYLEMVATLSNLLRTGSNGDLYSLLDLQVNNPDLSDFGWGKLLGFANYALKKAKHDLDKNNFDSEKERRSIDTSYAIETYKAEKPAENFSKRDRDLGEMLDEHGSGSLHTAIDFFFIAPLAGDQELFSHFCTVFLR